MSFWTDKRVCVTGGAGFLGSHLQEELARRGAEDVFVPEYPAYDLVQRDAIVRMLDDAKPDIIIHLAAVVGGIGANMANPGRYFYDNAMMGIQLIEEARKADVAQVRGARHDLRVPEVRADPVPRRRPVERVPRRDQRAVRAGQEDDAGAVPGVPSSSTGSMESSCCR